MWSIKLCSEINGLKRIDDKLVTTRMGTYHSETGWSERDEIIGNVRVSFFGDDFQKPPPKIAGQEQQDVGFTCISCGWTFNLWQDLFSHSESHHGERSSLLVSSFLTTCAIFMWHLCTEFTIYSGDHESYS